MPQIRRGIRIIRLARTGPRWRSGRCQADVTGNSVVDVDDLLLVLSNWT
jgi:hypothetical protein